MPDIESFVQGREKICVVGLGYVGLPLAVLLARKFKVCGFDISKHRIAELGKGFDHTGEIVRLSRNGKAVLIDIKGVYARAEAEKLGITYWRL